VGCADLQMQVCSQDFIEGIEVTRCAIHQLHKAQDNFLVSIQLRGAVVLRSHCFTIDATVYEMSICSCVTWHASLIEQDPNWRRMGSELAERYALRRSTVKSRFAKGQSSAPPLLTSTPPALSFVTAGLLLHTPPLRGGGSCSSMGVAVRV
jgi:hypothetical protein